MIVYLLWDWDPMASSWGEEYLAGIYSTQALAEVERDRRNEGLERPKARIETRKVMME